MTEPTQPVVADERADLVVRSSTTVHHGMVWDVRRDEVVLGDGQTVTREEVSHTGAVGVIAPPCAAPALVTRAVMHGVSSGGR